MERVAPIAVKPNSGPSAAPSRPRAPAMSRTPSPVPPPQRKHPTSSSFQKNRPSRPAAIPRTTNPGFSTVSPAPLAAFSRAPKKMTANRRRNPPTAVSLLVRAVAVASLPARTVSPLPAAAATIEAKAEVRASPVAAENRKEKAVTSPPATREVTAVADSAAAAEVAAVKSVRGPDKHRIKNPTHQKRNPKDRPERTVRHGKKVQTSPKLQTGSRKPKQRSPPASLLPTPQQNPIPPARLLQLPALSLQLHLRSQPLRRKRNVATADAAPLPAPQPPEAPAGMNNL